MEITSNSYLSIFFETFKEIAESQPLLNEYYTHYSVEYEKYKNCRIKKVISTEHHMRFINVIINNEAGEDSRERVDMHEFMIMMKNTILEDVDFKELEFTRDKINLSEKESLLENIKNYKLPTSYRNKRERLANRVMFEKYMAIEKSQILIDNMPNDVFVVGTDFYENTLIDKKSSHVFCNPPYSDYSMWSERIIKESNANVIYLVIPKRWGSQGNIAHAIKQRNATVSIVGNFDFFESEDREARAKVSLVKIDLRASHKNRYGVKTKIDEVAIDPFNLWFNETFKIDAKNTQESDYQIREQKAKEHKKKMENAIVNGSDLVSSLVEIYNQELNKLNSNYLKLAELDADILKELNVNLKNLLAAFKEKIAGLKNLYWKEIFSNLSSITTRLTSRTREILLDTLMSNTNIDFTTGNIRSVVIWVIKNSSKYFNSQMLQVYDDFTTEDGIRLYKSNSNFMNDTWRYCRSEKDKTGKYALDYRIVCHGYRSKYGSKTDKSTLSNAQRQYVQDIVIIAKNLGFAIDGIDYERLILKEKNLSTFNPDKTEPYKVGTKTTSGKIEEVYCQTHIPNENGEEVMLKGGVYYVYRKDQTTSWYQYKIDNLYIHEKNVRSLEDVFTTIRGHSNGNVHFQFNQEFIKKLNLEVGRLRGWIKTPKEAAEEFDISLEEAQKYWKCTYEVLPSTFAHLLSVKKAEPIYDIRTLESGEIELFKDEVKIRKSENGMILNLIKEEHIPEEIEKDFINRVFELSKQKQKNVIATISATVIDESKYVHANDGRTYLQGSLF